MSDFFPVSIQQGAHFRQENLNHLIDTVEANF